MSKKNYVRVGDLMAITIRGREENAPSYLQYAVCVENIAVGYGDMKLCLDIAKRLDKHPILALDMMNAFGGEVQD